MMDNLSINELTKLIKDNAIAAGFDLCGIARAGLLEENGRFLSEWCDSGMHAGMGYLSGNIHKRIDPSLLLPGVKSVIVTGLNYYTARNQGGGDVPVISLYAYGQDYHEVILKKLSNISNFINEIDKSASCRFFVDSVPFFEKPWAQIAGLGWQGKHSVVINEKIGSFFFIGVILTTLELDYDTPAVDRCGNCTLCIEACPTGAINNNRTINAGKCISYQTIENKDPLTTGFVEKLEGRIIGCDRCQEVCPWNKNAAPHNVQEFRIPEELRKMTSEDWLNMTEEDYARLFGESAISRRKFEVFKQNVTNVINSIRNKRQDKDCCA